MQETQLPHHISWLHFMNPSSEDLQTIRKHFPSIHPIVAEELLVASERSKVENFGEYLFTVYHLPIYNPINKTSRRTEIDFIITHEAILTVSYERLDVLIEFKKDVENKKYGDILSTGIFLYHLLEKINQFSLRELHHIEKKVNAIGSSLFASQNASLLEKISYVRRDILEFSIIATPQKAIIESLIHEGKRFWGDDIHPYFSGILGDFLNIHYLFENLKESIDSYSDTITQMLQFRTSEIMRKLSIVSVLTFPLLLYSTVALQPQVADAFIKNHIDFWIVFGVIAIITTFLAFLFKKKKWL